ncbi:endonuclease-reverse transcriptase [Elysia marginata]|uniref:Endonuclease-reverse transcriptase n=1 Tax=Elysia marginata TaxID=1093978 RepID=A0AAV4GYM9_9GAST|nr:endonuclease-reverse transcriptase [Elysia marginata]
MNSNSAGFLNITIGNSFKTTVGVRQGCLLSPVLFNIFLERIMQDNLHQHSPTISIGGRPVCNLRFADDIDLIAGSQAELLVLTDRLVASSKAFGMEVSSEKSKIMVSSERVNDASITMDDDPLELVHKFKYLGVTLHEDDSSTVEVRTRIALATAAFAKLGKIWKSSISFKAKHKLFRSLVISILIYGCETWTLLADTERRIQVFENKCLRKLFVQRSRNKRVCPRISRCICWSARTFTGDSETAETGLVWTCHQTRQSFQDNSPGHSGRQAQTKTTKEGLV